MDVRTANDASRYDAFISYSRRADRKLASALQQALHRFDKPWNRLRAVRVFRDDASMAADPRLWSAIERALDASRHFILLASPAAAKSAGVAHELRYWLENRSQDNLLIGLTEGELNWIPGEGIDAATTTSLPAELFDRFRTEPRYIDLRWARDLADLSLRDARFQDVVAEFAAPLHDKPKDALIGDDVRQHRRTIRVRNAAIATLAALLVASVAAAIRARLARNEAVRQRDVARSRALAMQANQLRLSDPVLSRRLSVAAYDISPTVEARGSLLSTASLPPVTRMADRDGPTFALAASGDGHRLVTAGLDGTVRVWSTARPGSPVRLADVQIEKDLLASVALSPDGSLFAAGTAGGSIHVGYISESDETRLIAQLPDPARARVAALAVDPTGRMLAGGGGDGTVRLWDLTDPAAPRLIAEMPAAHDGGVRSVAFSPDGGLLATGGADRTARLWEVTAGSGLAATGQVAEHDAAVVDVAFSPDGRLLVSGSSDQTVRLWQAVGADRLSVAAPPLLGHQNAVYGVAVSPDGTCVASASNDSTVRVWSLTDLGTRAVLPHPQNVQAVAFLGDRNELATVGDDGALRVWHLPGPRLVNGSGPLLSVVTSRDGRIVITGGLDGAVHLWDIADPDHPQPLGTLPAESTGQVQRLALSTDGDLLAVPRNGGGFELWDISDPHGPLRVAAVPDAHDGKTFTAAFHPDGRILATGGPDGQVLLWDIAEPSNPTPLGDPIPPRSGAIWVVAFSPDGRTLAAGGGDCTTWLYDVSRPEAAAQLGAPLDGLGGSILGLAFSPDAPLLATAGSNGQVWLWDVSDAAAPRNKDGRPAFEQDGGAALWVAFDRAGHIVVANADGSTRIADVDSPDSASRARLVGHDQAVYSVACTPDGARIVTASADGTAIVWRTDETAAAYAALTGVGDPLTERERRQYLPEPAAGRRRSRAGTGEFLRRLRRIVGRRPDVSREPSPPR